MAVFNVMAHWDADAHVWWAESEDVSGLVVEASTHEELIDELRHMVPELLAMNLPDTDRSNVSIKIVSDQVEDVCYA